METRKKHKSSLLGAAGALLLMATWSFFPDRFYPQWDTDFIRSLKAKLESYNSTLPEDRVYLQLDKPFYEPGDDLWFAAYLRDGATLKPSLQSEILHVELIDPKGAVADKRSLIANKGLAKGDFTLDPELPGGIYKVRAYTNWMKNAREENVFEKQIQVQKVQLPVLKMKMDFVRKSYGPGDEVQVAFSVNTNENKPLVATELKFQPTVNNVKLKEGSVITDEDGEATIMFKLPATLATADGLLNVKINYQGSVESISRSIPIVLNRISLMMFPEGGELIAGIPCRVAFSAKNEFGKPADVSGEILDSRNNKVCDFKSLHQGLGDFIMTAVAGEKYYARIITPMKSDDKIKLPEPLAKGYQLSVGTREKDKLGLTIHSPVNSELSLVAQVRGKVYYATAVKAIQGSQTINMPTSEFPAGVAMITLFDKHGIERAERLVFVNKHRQMNISMTTDKKQYLPREKVKMTITVKDEEGLPLPAHLSLAVVNDQLISFADNRDGNLVSQLLLEQDLKEKVTEPTFYFDPKQALADKALDLLLMTSGWRRFAWEEIIEEKPIAISYPAERKLIAGTITDVYTGAALGGALIKEGERLLAKTDSVGHFIIKGLDLSDDHRVTISHASYQNQEFALTDYNEDLQVSLYSNNYKGWSSRNKSAHGMIPQMAAVPEMDMMVASVAEEANIEKKLEREEAPAPAKAVPHDDNDVERLEGKVMADARMMPRKPVVANGRKYYRARQFPVKKYQPVSGEILRTDFPSTLYWNPDVVITHKGIAELEFFTADEITSFAAIAEGISHNGMTGRTEYRFHTQLPFQVRVKLPEKIVSGDQFIAPITLINNSDKPLGGKLSVSLGNGLSCVKLPDEVQTIMPHDTRVLPVRLIAGATYSTAEVQVTFNSCSLEDAVKKTIHIVPQGFPVSISHAGQQKEKEFAFTTRHTVPGSMKITFNAFPDVTTDLLKGVEGILQEPYGCFEQTSCTAYPNAMVIDYLKQAGKPDAQLLAKANALMDRGYKRLVGFEAGSKGYEWFGASPAHEGLTAYGIMEFVDMQRAGQSVDEEMLRRTVNWLLSHRDGKGGFEREKRALHDFGRISDDVLNAYIVFALAEAGVNDIEKEFAASERVAVSAGDAYLLALTSIAAYDLGKGKSADKLLSLLKQQQANDGSFNGKTHSITYSEGSSLKIEATALGILAMLKSSGDHAAEINKAVKFLLASRSGSGVFSSTQGTILSLKALTAYAKHSKKIAKNGRIEIFVDGKKVAEQVYFAGSTKPVSIDGLERFVKGTEHRIKIYFTEGDALPYTLAINYYTELPSSDPACEIEVKTTLNATDLKVGETARLAIDLKNIGSCDLPSAVAVIGLPAGCSAQPWQLKELQEKNVFDYYEIKDNAIAFYYRGMAEHAAIKIQLDLKAELAGTFSSPASCSYLYYKNEHKSWCATDRLKIN